MRKNFDEELNRLNIKLLDMAAMAQQIIAMSVKSLDEHDKKLAAQAIEFDDRIDEVERDIERMCLKIMLKYQPVFADDLRRVSSALKMITDMERIGDQAADIAQLNLALIENERRCSLKDISQMAKASAEMVSLATDAYINNDIELAQSVIKSDDEIDDLFIKIKSEAINEIAQDKGKGEDAIDEVMVAKYFERIGDHAVNIAEWVEFSITGVHKHERIM